MNCIYVDLPCSVGGFVKETCEPDGDYYNAVLNSRLSCEKLQEVYWHEVGHLDNSDFDSDYTVGEIETLRHK